MMRIESLASIFSREVERGSSPIDYLEELCRSIFSRLFLVSFHDRFFVQIFENGGKTNVDIS